MERTSFDDGQLQDDGAERLIQLREKRDRPPDARRGSVQDKGGSARVERHNTLVTERTLGHPHELMGGPLLDVIELDGLCAT